MALGKSFLTKYLIWGVKRCPVTLYIADFKNSGDYDSIVSDNYYATGSKCTELMDAFYERYTYIKENNLPEKILLLFDEWAAFCLWLEQQDKKLSKKYVDMLSEILMMGRKLGSSSGGAWIWCVLQRPDAIYFGSARSNFFVNIVMKDINKGIRNMLDIEKDEIPPNYVAKTGHGIIVLQGSELIPFIAPTYDENKMTKLLQAKR